LYSVRLSVNVTFAKNAAGTSDFEIECKKLLREILQLEKTVLYCLKELMVTSTMLNKEYYLLAV